MNNLNVRDRGLFLILFGQTSLYLSETSKKAKCHKKRQKASKVSRRILRPFLGRSQGGWTQSHF